MDNQCTSGGKLHWKYHSRMSVLQSKLLTGEQWLRHGFGTAESDNWCSAYTNLKQIHSDLVFNVDGLRGCIDRGDALLTSEPDHWVGVRTADCVPILLADPAHRVVAAVHAGWRGTVSSIVTKTVDRMTREFQTDPAQLLAAIGPAIGVCCFEVGADVARQFHSDSRTIDLPEVNRRQLEAAGVAPSRIDVMPLCTVCSGPKQFHSFRRDKELSGRMVSAICIGN